MRSAQPAHVSRESRDRNKDEKIEEIGWAQTEEFFSDHVSEIHDGSFDGSELVEVKSGLTEDWR